MTRIAITSCCKIQMVREQIGWSQIEAAEPDLLLLLGDTAYMHNSRWDHDGLDRRYREQFEEPHFASLVENVPFLATWDDHDFGTNDSAGGEIADWKRRKSRKLFDKHMWDDRLRHRIRKPRSAGIYYSIDFNDIRVIMVDVRYFRTGSRRRYATLLGDTQEQWLRDELDNDQRYTIVGSGTCIKDGADRQTFSDYRRFFDEFETWFTRRDRVLFASGDIHRNKFRDHGHYFEVISSGIGRPKMHGRYPNQRKGNPLDNWAIVDFGRTRVKVELHGRFSTNRGEWRIRSRGWRLN